MSSNFGRASRAQFCKKDYIANIFEYYPSEPIVKIKSKIIKNNMYSNGINNAYFVDIYVGEKNGSNGMSSRVKVNSKSKKDAVKYLLKHWSIIDTK